MTHIKSAILIVLVLAATVSGRQAPAPIGYDDTPMQPNGKWRVHDGTRPYPAIVTAAPASDAPALRHPTPSCCWARATISVRGRWPTARPRRGR